MYEINDTLKQKLAVYSSRLTRYKESNQIKADNNMFNKSEKQFYKKLKTSTKYEVRPPSKTDITNFWKNMWSHESKHNDKAYWIEEEEQIHGDIKEQEDYIVTEKELKQTIKQLPNWKGPGKDNIHNFWYKRFTILHKHLTAQINKVIQNPTEFPTFITPKNAETKIDTHLTNNNIIAEEQKGCRKHSQGCKEQLVIDSVIMRQATTDKRNICTCYIDYRKAFDTVPHSWLNKIMNIYKINPTLHHFLKTIMQTWNTQILLATNTEQIITETIRIKRGIFQGDSLSALWFCMCLNPLSNILNRTNYGFKIKHDKQEGHKITHLLYIDDIKIYAATKSQLTQLVKIIEKFTKDINMEFGIEKCKAMHIERGKLTDESEPETLNNEILTNMQINETYKYLGINQSTTIKHTLIKQQLKDEYKKRLNQILKTGLNSKNLFKAVNTYAIPTLTYSFGIIKWTDTDLENINILTRAQLTKHRKLGTYILTRQKNASPLADEKEEEV
ncbi:uncharacterized protein LOC116163840 [Photinus pyralis]|uniref:uncharacterized protein LOC116163840 n=1 Tax=Photinus pyralis TaxID=7054 RepID=UPI0012673340|nr:uncharacterized protein LOC116163840 [Photinus pyralis]